MLPLHLDSEGAMSFQLSQHVFYKSQHHGNAKVLLLALADYANDCCGLAWPAVDTLMAKVGVNLRNTHKLLKHVSSGAMAELEVLVRAGPHKVTLYRFRGVSLETGCRDGQGVLKHQKGCPWRHGVSVSVGSEGVSPETDNLSVPPIERPESQEPETVSLAQGGEEAETKDRPDKPPLVAIQQRLGLPPETNTHDYATFNGTYGHCRRCGERAVQPGPCAQASA
jgi:hypothetical protein